HTRSYGDWSSDVCSSDLVVRPDDEVMLGVRAMRHVFPQIVERGDLGVVVVTRDGEYRYADLREVVTVRHHALPVGIVGWMSEPRSEERRVGKEGRAKWGG